MPTTTITIDSVPPGAIINIVVYFRFDQPPNTPTFTIKLTDTQRIQHARNILSGIEQEAIHPSGTIIKQSASYNPPWSYHLDPDSIGFFAYAVEVCDADMQQVEEHLDEVGGAFLPGNRWCPWNSRLLEEVAP